MSVLVLLSLAFAAGIGVGSYFPAPPWTVGAVALAGAVAIYGSLRLQWWIALAFITTAFALGWVRPSTVRETLREPPSPPCHRLVQGQVISAPTRFEGRTRLSLELERWSGCLSQPEVGALTKVQGRLLVTILGDGPVRFLLGDRVRLRAKVKAIATPRNPGVGVRFPPKAIFTAAVPFQGAIALVQAGVWNPRHYFDRVRRHRAAFWNRILETPQANMARALTLGEAAVLDHAARQRFRRTGTAHLLSVSGLHLGLVVLFTYWIVRLVLIRITPLAQRFDVGRFAAACAVPAAVAFALLAGGRIPVVRAAVMATSALGARVFSRSSGTVEAMAIAAMALLARDSQSLFEPGFQLSFAAVIAFFATLPREREEDWSILFPVTPSLLQRAWGGLCQFGRVLFRSSLVAAAATTPIALVHFGYVSLIAVPINVLAVPLTGFVIMPGLLAVTVFAGTFPGLATWIGKGAGMLLGGFDLLLEKISCLPCTLENPGPLMQGAVWAVSLGILFYLAGRRRTGSTCAAIALVLFLAAWVGDPPPFPRDKLTVDFLDVGQGDATLITFPDGTHWLIDAGGSNNPRYNVGERIVVPVLRSLGVKRIAKLILTHPDRDHVGGVPAVLQAVKVDEVWENGQGAAEGADERYHRALKMATEQGLTLRRTPAICGGLEVAGAHVSVIHPCVPGRGYDPTLSFNDNSIVLAVRYGMVSLLLGGDIETTAETILYQSRRLFPVDVLKLPHHGSGTSSSAVFLDVTRPAVAVASVGLFNPYGLPHGGVRGRLQEREISLKRTDRHGAVRLVG
ncbi:MAG: DNA internalization-related competence protein ComEC/Rec2, partial [Desulfobacterales bacterium]|nr:DNA internalization-related competence protein ComEC/Rec2 [Desulfobacterales bacterium]